MKIKKFLKISISPIFSFLFLVLTKIKFAPILGTKMKFSLGVFFGPTLAKIFGISYGTGIIIFAQLIGLLFGVYKIKATKDFFTFFPIIFAGIYFAKIFKGEKKLVFIPLICILLFILHPIGSKVWFYSLFWLIPIFITVFKENLDRILRIPVFKIYGYSLGSAFVDHGVGSVIYLYLLRIPANFWIEAIPHTILERLLIAGGISFFYLFEITLFIIFDKLPIFEKVKSLIFE